MPFPNLKEISSLLGEPMFKFLFGKKAEDAVVVETQRETFERLIKELNDAIDVLPEKPTITISPEMGHIGLVLPDRLPDEALKLPAPDDSGPAEPVESASKPVATPEADPVKVAEDATTPTGTLKDEATPADGKAA